MSARFLDAHRQKTHSSPKDSKPRYTPLVQSPAIQSSTVQRFLQNNGVDDSQPYPFTPHDLSYLQSAIGNRAVQRLIVDPTTQKHEAEADQMSKSVSAFAAEPSKRIQRYNGNHAADDLEGGVVGDELAARIKGAQGGGSPMPGHIRETLQPKLGADLKNVKVHTDGNAVQLARELNAQAFTFKNHIFYGQGKSPNDLALTAHETVHTIQQGAVARHGMTWPKQNDKQTEAVSPHSAQRAAPAIQRLINRQGLVDVAGEPHKDKTFLGLKVKKMSTAYKSVLDALNRYHGYLRSLPTTEPGGIGFNRDAVTRINGRLDALSEELQRYVDNHADDTVRTPHIRAIIENGIPRERVLLAKIAQNSGAYLYKSFADAIPLAEVQDQVASKFSTQATRQLREVDEAEQKSALAENRTPKSSVSGLTGDTLKARTLEMLEDAMIEAGQGGKEVTSFDFRGNTGATKMGAALGEELTRSYVQSVILPALHPALNTKDQDIEIDPTKIAEVDDKKKQAILAGNTSRLKQLYRNFMQLFTPEAAKRVPMPFAQFCTELYDTSSQYMSDQHAYLMVSSQIFLRTVNPVLTFTVASIGQGQPGQRALMLLAKLVQDDANSIQHGLKEPYLEVMSSMSYSDQIRNFVAAVIALGKKDG